MEESSSSSSDSLLVAAMKLASASALPMALRFALELDLFNLIRNAASASASASELSAQLPAKNRPHAAAMIDRVLRLLAANSILTCTAAGDEWRYSLAPLGNLFATNQDGVSLLPFSLLIQDKVFIDTWYHLKDAAMEGGVAFDRAHGMNAFEYPETDGRFNKVFNEAMRNQSTIFMSRILEKYNGFEGVHVGFN